MGKDFSEGQKVFGIVALLVLQVAVLWVSLDDWHRISAFCTVPQAEMWAWIAYVHLILAVLLFLGFASIFWARLRIWYAVLLCLGLSVLPLQAWLVRQGQLTCDAP